MKFKFILLLLITFSVSSCSDNDDSSEEVSMPEPNLKYSISGMPEILLENVSGTGFGSNYEAGFTESAQIIATNNSNDIVVQINLVDNDMSILAIQPGESLTINNSMSTDIYATLTIIENGNIYEASSGTVNISFYDLKPNSVPDKIIVSGSFNVSDGTAFALGSFTEIELDCTECGG